MSKANLRAFREKQRLQREALAEQRKQALSLKQQELERDKALVLAYMGDSRDYFSWDVLDRHFVSKRLLTRKRLRLVLRELVRHHLLTNSAPRGTVGIYQREGLPHLLQEYWSRKVA